MRIVVIGDSITAGQHLPEGEPAWPSFLPGEVLARGVPGDTTRLGLERFPRDVQNLEPDVVVIQFGHNDANRWQTDRGLPRVSMWSFITNLEEMIERVQAFGATPILCSITESHRSEVHFDDCVAYDAALRFVADRAEVPVADVRRVITRAHLLDGLHLNAAGHLAYAAVVTKALP